MSERYYLVMQLMPWSAIEAPGSDGAYRPLVPPGSAGDPRYWVAAFETQEAAKAWSGGTAEVLEVEVTPGARAGRE